MSRCHLPPTIAAFYVSIARELGVARGLSFSGQQVKLRVEETLRASGIILAFDESQYLWGERTAAAQNA